MREMRIEIENDNISSSFSRRTDKLSLPPLERNIVETSRPGECLTLKVLK
tara:strand:- start:1120 stop:1269 length:150 start_codon:yes stop_codon:yes gene_type:complete